MASFVLFAGSDLARQLNDGETGFIAQIGALATVGAAVSGTGAVDVTVLGSVYSGIDSAVTHSGTTLELYVGPAGSIVAGAVDAVRSDITLGAQIVNDGLVASISDALDIRVSDEGATIEIINSGVLSGVSDGIVTNSGDEITRITNHGVITGGDGGIDHLGGEALVINFGEIVGQQDYGYDGADQVDRVRNFGSIEGGVFTQGGDDVVTNRGYIDDVRLGDGDDVYNGVRGGVDRPVRGGAGDDTLRGGAEGETLRGDRGADALYGGGGDDTLRGDDGGDLLAGGRGDDTLIGGNGPDRFLFAAGGGFDTIEDFGGRDRIDLTALGLESFRASVRDQIRDASGGALIDLREGYDLQIFLAGVEASALARADFLI